MTVVPQKALKSLTAKLFAVDMAWVNLEEVKDSTLRWIVLVSSSDLLYVGFSAQLKIVKKNRAIIWALEVFQDMAISFHWEVPMSSSLIGSNGVKLQCTQGTGVWTCGSEHPRHGQVAESDLLTPYCETGVCDRLTCADTVRRSTVATKEGGWLLIGSTLTLVCLLYDPSGKSVNLTTRWMGVSFEALRLTQKPWLEGFWKLSGIIIRTDRPSAKKDLYTIRDL